MKRILSKPLQTIFFLSLALSFLIHLGYRNDHFQDVDSAMVFSLLRDFPASALRTTALTYPEGRIFSTSTAQKILADKNVSEIRGKYLPSISDEFIINQLTRTSFPAMARYGFIQAVEMLDPFFPIKSFFIIPLSSTYSAGPGLIYGLLSTEQAPYADFMSRATALTLALFHLSILLLYLINRRLGVSEWINVLISTIALFSISLYSSGYHLGSTVWNFFTVFVWIWYVQKNSGRQDFPKRVSMTSGFLVFFNYLIALFWIAFLLASFTESVTKKMGKSLPTRESLRLAFDWLKITVTEQRIALLLIGLCGILFFQSGQGFRGSASLSELPGYFFYTVLNFSSWYTKSHAMDMIQFAGGLLLIFSLFGYLMRRSEDSGKIIRDTFIWLIAIYALAVFFNKLSFLPTRHVLFLSPILFIGAAKGVDALLRRFESPRKILSILLIASFTFLGFTCLQLRRDGTNQLLDNIRIDESIESYEIYDMSHDLYYHLADKSVPVRSADAKSFVEGKEYVYLSHTAPFSFALAEWQSKLEIEIETEWVDEIVLDTYFTAYNPNFEKLRYSRPNNLYQSKFKVIKLKTR